MISDPQVLDQADVDRIVFAVRRAETQTPPADNATGFCSFLAINVADLDENCRHWLSESLLGEVKGESFMMGYLDSGFRLVVFKSEEAAKDSAKALKHNLDRKFLFGLYRSARKKYSMPPEEEQPVKFFN